MLSGWHDDEVYYSARAKKERDLASGASEFGIARIHENMAERYEILAAAARSREDAWDAPVASANPMLAR